MKTNKKQVYEAPEMKVLVIELEQGIAGASGSANPSSSPGVSDWINGPSDIQNGEGQ